MFADYPAAPQNCVLTKRSNFVVTTVGKELIVHKDETLYATLKGHSRKINMCAVDATGRTILSASQDKTVKVWDGYSATLRHTLSGHTKAVTSCAIDDAGTTIVSGSRDRTVKVWDAQTGTLRHTFREHTASITACAIDAVGHFLVSASDDHTLRLWDIHLGTARFSFTGHRHKITGCTISADGRIIISVAEDKTIKVWNTETLCCMTTLHVDSALRCCVISIDGQWLIAGGDGGVYFLRLVGFEDIVKRQAP
jgi:WD40 repeat protein